MVVFINNDRKFCAFSTIRNCFGWYVWNWSCRKNWFSSCVTRFYNYENSSKNAHTINYFIRNFIIYSTRCRLRCVNSTSSDSLHYSWSFPASRNCCSVCRSFCRIWCKYIYNRSGPITCWVYSNWCTNC